jgi:hypothetical protein
MEAETAHHIIFGECLIENRLTTRVMDCWQAGHSSLRDHEPIRLHHAAVGHLDAHRPLHQHRPGWHHPDGVGSFSVMACPPG